MTRFSAAFGLLALSTLTFLSSGCGKGTPSTVPVSGTLKFEDGKPVSGASIRFISNAGGRDAIGSTGKDGTFSLSTFNSDDGAIPGEYTIIVTKVVSTIDASGNDSKNLKPEDMMNMYKKNLSGGGAKKKDEDPVPPVYSDAKTSPLKWKIDSSTSSVALKLKRS